MFGLGTRKKDIVGEWWWPVVMWGGVPKRGECVWWGPILHYCSVAAAAYLHIYACFMTETETETLTYIYIYIYMYVARLFINLIKQQL
jgi:hypothetical protein